MSGKKILDGLKDAVAGNFSAVTIEGQHWVRQDTPMTLPAEYADLVRELEHHAKHVMPNYPKDVCSRGASAIEKLVGERDEARDRVGFLEYVGREREEMLIEKESRLKEVTEERDGYRACFNLQSARLKEAVEVIESLIYDAELQMKNPSHHQPFTLPKARQFLKEHGADALSDEIGK